MTDGPDWRKLTAIRLAIDEQVPHSAKGQKSVTVRLSYDQWDQVARCLWVLIGLGTAAEQKGTPNPLDGI